MEKFIYEKNCESVLKGIINPKNQFSMHNTNFILFWFNQALLDGFFKKSQYISYRNLQKLGAIKTRSFLLTFPLFLQTIQLSENIDSHTTSQILIIPLPKE